MNLHTDDFFWGLALSNARLASSYSTSKQVRLKCISWKTKKNVGFKMWLEIRIVQMFYNPNSKQGKGGDSHRGDHFLLV